MRLSPTLASAAAAALAALAVALAQPLSAPWWLYADSDAPYAASSFKLATGQPTAYFDQPGFPLQELFAVTFEARRLAAGAPDRTSFEDAQLRDLGQSTPYWRGFAVAFWVLGALAVSFVASRLLGGWWGLAGGLLWLGTPALTPMAIQYRPDVLLTALCAVFGLLLVRAAQRHDARLYLAAASLAGFTTTVKANGAGLFAPLVLAMLVWPVDRDWSRGWGCSMRRRARRHWLALALVVDAAAALVWWFNRGSLPPPTTSEEQRLFAAAAAAIGGYALLAFAVRRVPVARRVFQPAIAAAAAAFCAGALVPVLLFPSYGLAMLARVQQTWTGGGVNQGLRLFDFPHDEFLHRPLQQTGAVFLLAAAAAVVAARRREPGPILLFVSAAVMLVLGLARLGTHYYFAPTFVLAVPAALWLVASTGRRAAPVIAAALTLYVVVPQLVHVRDAAHSAAAQERQAQVMERDAAVLLRPGETALVDQEAPTPDSRYNGMVENFVEDVPPRAQARFYDDFWRSPDWLRARRLTVRYYIGRRALEIAKPTTMDFVIGRYVVRPLPRYARRDLRIGVLQLVSGPGIDRPYPSLNASG